MKKLLVISLLLLSSAVTAQNTASIVPSNTNLLLNEPDCLIYGDDVECIADGKARVPITNMTINCISGGDIESYLKYLDDGKKVELFVGLNQPPKITIGLLSGSEPLEGNFIYFGINYPGGTLTHGDVSHLGGCAVPPTIFMNDFMAAGKSWKVEPVFSLTQTTIAFEALIFQRQ